MRYYTRIGRGSGVSFGIFGTAIVAVASLIWGAILLTILVLAYFLLAVAALAGGTYLRYAERNDPRHATLATYVYGLWQGFKIRVRRSLRA